MFSSSGKKFVLTNTVLVLISYLHCLANVSGCRMRLPYLISFMYSYSEAKITGCHCLMLFFTLFYECQSLGQISLLVVCPFHSISYLQALLSQPETFYCNFFSSFISLHTIIIIVSSRYLPLLSASSFLP